MRPPLLAFVILAALVRPAAAGPAEEAREQTRRGTAAYNLGSYEEAARFYEEAYRLVSAPELLFNVGQAWRQAGRPDKALVAYKAYLRTAQPHAPNREQVERRVAELEKLVAETRRTQSAPPPGTLSAPGEVGPQPENAHAAPPLAVQAAPAPAEPAPSRWYLWAGLGAVVAGAVVTALVLSSHSTRASTCGAGIDYCAPVRP